MKELRLRTRLVSSTLRLKGAEKFVGKDVEVTVREVASKSKLLKKWTHFGEVVIGGKLDKTNIRDLAYE